MVSNIHKLIQCINVMQGQFNKVAVMPTHVKEALEFNNAYDVAYSLLIQAQQILTASNPDSLASKDHSHN